MNTIKLRPVGIVRSSRAEIQDDNWDKETCFVELDQQFTSSDSTSGLSDFSHVEVLFFMDRVDPTKIEISSRHPRNNSEWPKVGIFAQRGKNRPNQIGLTICRLIKVDGLRIYLEGLDAVDGTPILDIKPWVKEFGPRGEVTQPNWISELMVGYWSQD